MGKRRQLGDETRGESSRLSLYLVTGFLKNYPTIMPLSYNTNNLLWDRKVDFCTLLTPEATKSWTFCRAVSYVYILYRLAVSYILSIPTEALLFIL